VILKLGTRVITDDSGGLNSDGITEIVAVAAALHASGREVLLVTSGAVGLGAQVLGLTHRPEGLATRQACAAVGQTQLMALYGDLFRPHQIATGQILLSENDLNDRARYLNLRNSLLELLRHRVIPILNENDALSVDELAWQDAAGEDDRPVFGDNDRLSALVASKMGADLLVLLTDVQGVFDRDPHLGDSASLLPTLAATKIMEIEAGESHSGVGRGGMASKVTAAAIAARSGCDVIIASGRQPSRLADLFAGHSVGTHIPAVGSMPARRRWIAWATAPQGTLHLDNGAVDALIHRGASLLAAGVVRIEGAFQRGDIVELRGPDGKPIGRGMVHCDAHSTQSWIDGNPPAFSRNHHALVHRDNLVLDT